MRQLTALLLLLAAPAAARPEGDPLPVSVGDRVRAREEGGASIKAQVVEVLPDAVVVRVNARAQARRLDLSRLERLEVSRGDHGHAGVGAVAGFVPAFLFGAILGGALCAEDSSEVQCNAVAGALYVGVIFGAVSGAIGALVGWAIRTEEWERVHLPGLGTVRLEPVVIPVRGGAGAGLTLRFGGRR